MRSALLKEFCHIFFDWLNHLFKNPKLNGSNPYHPWGVKHIKKVFNFFYFAIALNFFYNFSNSKSDSVIFEKLEKSLDVFFLFKLKKITTTEKYKMANAKFS